MRKRVDDFEPQRHRGTEKRPKRVVGYFEKLERESATRSRVRLVKLVVNYFKMLSVFDMAAAHRAALRSK